jgi:anti-anti-sigma factor
VLPPARTADIVVDLSGTRFLDAAGIGALVLACSLARDAGARLAVRGASGLVAAVLRVTRADQVLSSPADPRPAAWPGG